MRRRYSTFWQSRIQWSAVGTRSRSPRLCKALLDRITDRAHVIETGPDSFRFKRTLANRGKR
ncbi:MAG: hypothetical protein FJW39_27880 [Acidobacteria bacterium]|nr:hypothetical protein [Acidobacteriota bacterium]